MNDVDRLLARAQVGLAFLFAVAFIIVLLVLLLSLTGVKELPAAINALLTGLLGVFGTIITLQQNYFFARQRPPALPDSVPAPPAATPGGSAP